MLFLIKAHSFKIAFFGACFCVLAAFTAHKPDYHARPDLTEEEFEKALKVLEAVTQFDRSENFERRSAGAATSLSPLDHNAFSQPLPSLSFEERKKFALGNSIFRKKWVSSPATTTASDGLGPHFNARSCQLCHLKDGRGHPPQNNEIASSLVVKLGQAETRKQQHPLYSEIEYTKNSPDPGLGMQLQTFSTQGLAAEGQLRITYEEYTVELNGGERVTLRKPSYSIVDSEGKPLAKDTAFSARVAPPMIGLGLLEAIHPNDILQREDRDDRDEDGISGRANWQFLERSQNPEIGRFGWKATAWSVRTQTEIAFSTDIGISSEGQPAPWGDCTEQQASCRSAAHGVSAEEPFEITNQMLDLVEFYSRNLAVPVRRNENDPSVLAGKEIFYSVGCESCHRAKYVTRKDVAQESLQYQLIWPYTDLLVHDMGRDLADDLGEGVAKGSEWRTPPLWGIGLTKEVSGHTLFLHDGRARNLLEAILWHGGEAETAKNKVIDLSPAERENLIKFLESL